MTTSQLDGQEVGPFPAGDHKASINRRTRRHKKQDRNSINDPQKKQRLGAFSKIILLEGFKRFHGTPTSPLVPTWIRTQKQNINKTNDPQKKHRLGTVSKRFKPVYRRANLTLSLAAKPRY